MIGQIWLTNWRHLGLEPYVWILHRNYSVSELPNLEIGRCALGDESSFAVLSEAAYQNRFGVSKSRTLTLNGNRGFGRIRQGCGFAVCTNKKVRKLRSN